MLPVEVKIAPDVFSQWEWKLFFLMYVDSMSGNYSFGCLSTVGVKTVLIVVCLP